MKYYRAFNLLVPLSTDRDRQVDGENCSFEYFQKSKFCLFSLSNMLMINLTFHWLMFSFALVVYQTFVICVKGSLCRFRLRVCDS
jgi:hypothetical protein